MMGADLLSIILMFGFSVLINYFIIRIIIKKYGSKSIAKINLTAFTYALLITPALIVLLSWIVFY